jgi:hypothetical protein
MLTIVNLETGEIQEVELTAEEVAEREELQAQGEAREAEATAKAAARNSALAKLADLGLTAEEVAAL